MNKKILLIIGLLVLSFATSLFVLKRQGIIGDTTLLESDNYRDIERSLGDENTSDLPEETEEQTDQTEPEEQLSIPTEEILFENCKDYAKAENVAEDDLAAYLDGCVNDLKNQYLNDDGNIEHETIEEKMGDEAMMPPEPDEQPVEEQKQ